MKVLLHNDVYDGMLRYYTGDVRTLSVVLNWMRCKPIAVMTARQKALTYVHHMMLVLMVENHSGPMCLRLFEYCSTWKSAWIHKKQQFDTSRDKVTSVQTGNAGWSHL